MWAHSQARVHVSASVATGVLAPGHDAAGVRPPQLRHSVEADTQRPVAGDPARHTQLIARHLSTESLAVKSTGMLSSITTGWGPPNTT